MGQRVNGSTGESSVNFTWVISVNNADKCDFKILDFDNDKKWGIQYFSD